MIIRTNMIIARRAAPLRHFFIYRVAASGTDEMIKPGGQSATFKERPGKILGQMTVPIVSTPDLLSTLPIRGYHEF